MKLKRFKEIIEDAPVNATGSAVATNEPIVRKKRKRNKILNRDIGTPELLKIQRRYTCSRECNN